MILASTPSGSVGLGLVILAVGFLMAGGAGLSLRSIWGRASQPAPEDGGRPLRSQAVGEMRTRFRLLLSFDLGCLTVTAAVLLFLGFTLIFRAL
ncbi:MAG: hypothetical protein WBU92_11690 [Candidatus Dormiibacterota bacterium]